MLVKNVLTIPAAVAVLLADVANSQNSTRNGLSAAVYKAIDNQRDELGSLNHEIWEHPELAYNEVYAHKVLTDYLEAQGFTITRGAYGISTAFRAEYSKGSGRKISFNAEYDALPGMGHACGHNLIATASIAAAIGVKESLSKGEIQGTVVVLGTPAEEVGTGKLKLLEAGAYEDLDCSLQSHPGISVYMNHASSSAHWQGDANFTGFAVHASDPSGGRNAMDGFVAAYTMAGLYRQQLEETDRIHHIANHEDSQLVNVIPDHASSQWAVRAATVPRRDEVLERVKTIINAAATGTNTTVVIDQAFDLWNLEPNAALSRVYYETLFSDFNPTLDESTSTYFLLDVGDEIKNPILAASTDQGNVSHFLPAIHVFFPISHTASPHNIEFRSAAGTDFAFSQAIVTGKVLAMTGVEVLLNQTLAKTMWDEFNARTGPRSG